MRQLSALGPLLGRVASQTAGVLNVSDAGAATGLAASTASDYLKLFEAAFLVRLLPAWGRTMRVWPHGCFGRRPTRLASLDPAALQQFGHLLETFVAGEVLKQASWMEHRPHVGHWRTYDGAEADIVIEDGRDGSVVGIKVKPGSRIHPRDRRGLRILRDAPGDRFTAGVVPHTGPHSVRYRGPGEC